MRSLLNILFLFSVCAVYAQQNDADTVKTDTVRNRYLPTGIRFGTDVAALVKSRVQDSFNGWEVNADVDLYRYFLAFEYGNWQRTYTTDSAAYGNDGTYWRAGVDVNFLLKDPDRNMFFIGFRYGHSAFSENLTLISTDRVWGDFTQYYSNTNVQSHWKELTTGIRVKIWKMIWMGYTARFKFGLKNKGDSEMLPHDVPGYGRTDKESYWGFNYQILIRIPFRPLPPLPPVKK